MPQLAPASAQTTQGTVQEILDGNQVFIQNKQASLIDKPILKIEPDAKPTKQPDEVVLKAGKKVEVAQTGGLGIIQFPVGFVSGSVTNLDRLSTVRYAIANTPYEGNFGFLRQAASLPRFPF